MLQDIEKTRQEPQERNHFNRDAVRVGNLIVLAQPDRNTLDLYTQRLLDHAYQIQKTPHFVVCQKPSASRRILLHTFGEAEVDADLICFIENELPSTGIISSEKEYGVTLFAVLASTFPRPREQQAIWRLFCLNTLKRLRTQMCGPFDGSTPTISYIAPFAAIYRHTFDLYTGESLLDVGCSFGFLPILAAQRYANAHIVGCDKSPDAIAFSRDLAATTSIPFLQFIQMDVLSESFSELGIFDTVTAIHLLEHLPESAMPQALTHLLNVTAKRLIIAVPYEEQTQVLYGHLQHFTPERLHGLGTWCVEALKGKAQYSYSEVMGGMLIVDRILEEV